MFDVVVVGAGPGGAAAAKRCAERGLDTLLLEKKRLPREKVCSGLILGKLAHRLVAQEFGALPEKIVLSRMRGLALWMPGVGERRIPSETPITWRKDLDHWMVRQAQSAGVEVREDALVKRIESDGASSTLTARIEGGLSRAGCQASGQAGWGGHDPQARPGGQRTRADAGWAS